MKNQSLLLLGLFIGVFFAPEFCGFALIGALAMNFAVFVDRTDPKNYKSKSLDETPQKQVRQLTAREIDLLLFGANSLGSSYALRALRTELKNDPEIIEIGKKYGRDRTN